MKQKVNNPHTPKNIIAILGPTSSGKTTLGLKLASQTNGLIISFDSRQIYKYMDIGTGKIPVINNSAIVKNDEKWKIDGIDIYGYDLVTPNKYFSAYDYAMFAINKINELQSESAKPIIMVGGTGFYLDAVTGRKKLSGVLPDFELRKKLEKKPTKYLVTKLTSLNKEKSKKTDLSNRARIIRALEIELKKNSKQNTLPKLNKNTKFTYVGLTAERTLLYQRADNWLETIWENGLLDEIKWLLNNGYDKSEKLKGIIYKSALDYLNGDLDENVAKQKAKYSLHAYIRRQQTYFKTNTDIKWFDISQKNYGNLVFKYLIKV